MAMPTPPKAPPGASASAVLLAVARMTTGAGVVKVIAPDDVVPASVLRELSTRARVTPTAPRPVATLTVRSVAPCVPSAVTLSPPAPTGPCAPDDAFTVPPRPRNAIAALSPIPRPPETRSESDVTGSVAEPFTPETGPPAPRATLPIVAEAFPLTFTTPTAAPTAPRPAATPIAYALTLRCTSVPTERPPPALG